MASTRPGNAAPNSVFFNGLARYAAADIVRFHTPGHRGGRWLQPDFKAAVGPTLSAIDVSDVFEGDEVAHGWDEALRISQKRTAEVFRAGASRFLVNGSTGGMHVGVGALAPGGRVMCSRASHLSVYTACALWHCTLLTLDAGYDPEWDVPVPLPPDQVRAAIERDRPDLYIETYPNYYGLTPRLDEVISRVSGTRFLADEAHASHYLFCPGAPPTALDCGADVVVQSFHKTLGALTQASALHVAIWSLDLLPGIDRCLTVLQTTSASPLLLSSLEAATEQAAVSGREDWARACELAESMRARLESEVGCRVLSERESVQRWGVRFDPARVVANVSDVGWSGLHASAWLRKRGRIQAEMANQRSVVFLVSPGNGEEDVERLVRAMKEMARSEPPRTGARVVELPPRPPTHMPIFEALNAPAAFRSPRECVGRISAEFICPYPPGIPVLVPGEEVTSGIVEYLEHVQREGWEVRGATHPDLRLIATVEPGR